MDNNNGFYPTEPQKPFTDRTNPQAPQYNQPANDFQPEQPLMNMSEHSEQTEPPVQTEQLAHDNEVHHFTPVQHTSQYTEQSFQNQQTAPQQEYHNDYSQPTYHSEFNEYSAYGYYNNQEQQPYQQYATNNQTNYGFPVNQPPKKKAKTGLIVIIIVLCALLTLGISGIVAYVIVDAFANSTSISNDSAYPDIFDDYTLPDYGFGGKEEEEPADVPVTGDHDESDYTDKANPDYKGLELKDKPEDKDDKKYTTESAFNKVSESVVGIVCYAGEATTIEEASSEGSGIIITSDGYVVTNSHVIGNSKTAYDIQVITSDGKAYSAGVVGFDSRTDIAVLKTDDAKDLKPATFGDSDKIELGEDIIAVGNPGGLDYQNSITKGIVSAVNRELSSTSLVKYIQTDAAINPGNSGGPIVNLYGQVIGIATSKIVSEQFEGMGFAIPSTTAKDIVDSLMRNGYVEGRVKIGISGTVVDPVTAEAYKTPTGIQIAEVTPDGPCDGSPLVKGDIITEVDGQTVSSFADIYEILEQHKPGDKVEIKYYSQSSNEEDTFKITLQEDK